MKKLTYIFMVMILSWSSVIRANEAVEIRSAAGLQMAESRLIHGILVETQGIDDPNLTRYEVQVKEDLSSPFNPYEVYSPSFMPLASGNSLFIPYRNQTYVLENHRTYCVKLTAYYHLQDTTSSEVCGIELNATGDGTDEDGDGLTKEEELEFGTDPNSADSDDDGIDDKTELENGRDPNGYSPSILNIENTEIDFGWGHPSGIDRNQHQYIRIEKYNSDALIIEEVILREDPDHPGPIDSFRVGAVPPTIPGQSGGFYRVPVSYIPKTSGEHFAEVIFVTPAGESLPVKLKGQSMTTPHCEVEVASLDFGTVTVDDQELLIRNLRLKSLANPLPGVVVNENAAMSFTLHIESSQIAPAVRNLRLSPGEHRDIPIYYRHSGVGNHSTVIEIKSPYCAQINVPVSAEAIQ